MTTYTDVFGGANIYPSEINYSSYDLTANIILSWPEETSASENLATRIIDIASATGALDITLPDANKSGTGNTILFNNLSAYTITVKDADGVQVVTLETGTLWQVYLTNNTTAAGVWQALQYGAEISSANASALAGTGIVAVGTVLSQSVPITGFNGNYAAGVADRAKMFNWTGAVGTFALISATTLGSNWFCYLRNSGTGIVTVNPASAETINGEATLGFNPGDSAILACDGVSFYTIGYGQSAEFAFDYTSVDVAGSGNYTLSGNELNRIAYDFTGILTGNRDIIVPTTVQQYWVTNSTTGAHDLTVKTSGGTGITVVQGGSSILYCNGTDVVLADTGGISIPLAINQGGTAATTAGGALINLGGGATGISLFQSSTQLDAYNTLGVAPAGIVVGGTFP